MVLNLERQVKPLEIFVPTYQCPKMQARPSL